MFIAVLLIFHDLQLIYALIDVLIGPEPMDVCTSLPSLPCEFPISDVTVLQGHSSEVWSYLYFFIFMPDS